jgi:hypothetical protein
MLNDLGVPIGGFVVAEGGVEYPTLSGFLTPEVGYSRSKLSGTLAGLGSPGFRSFSGGTVLILPLLLWVFCFAERSIHVKVRKQPFL